MTINNLKQPHTNTITNLKSRIPNILNEHFTSIGPSLAKFAKFCSMCCLSRCKVISAIYKNWAVRQIYFENITTPHWESEIDTCPKVQGNRALLCMVTDNVNHLCLTFTLPVVTEFEGMNALFHPSKANTDRAFGELDLHYLTSK